MGFATGPAEGRTRWLNPSYELRYELRIKSSPRTELSSSPVTIIVADAVAISRVTAMGAKGGESGAAADNAPKGPPEANTPATRGVAPVRSADIRGRAGFVTDLLGSGHTPGGHSRRNRDQRHGCNNRRNGAFTEEGKRNFWWQHRNILHADARSTSRKKSDIPQRTQAETP
jgi:hypothetical protein